MKASYQLDIFAYIFEQTPLKISPHLSDAREHVKLVHAENDVFISLAKKLDGDWYQRSCKYDELNDKLVNLLASPEDTYMSVNAFKNAKRQLTSLNLVQGLYTDLDYYRTDKYKNFEPEEMYELLQKNVFSKGILPYPSFIISSGRGMQLLWLLEKVPVTNNSAALFQRIQDYIHDIFADYGADPVSRDATHVFRIAGTKNTKNNKTVGIHVFSEIPYSLRYFQNEVLPPLEKSEPKPKKHKTKIKHLYNRFSLHFARLQDLERLQSLRKGRCEGSRELMCFLYRYWSCCYTSDPSQALHEAIIFNQGFNPQLSENEVISATRSAEKAYKQWLEEAAKGYNYSNKRLISELAITPEEQRELQTIISTEEKYRRNNKRRNKARRNEAGMTARERAKQEKIQKVWELHNAGLKQHEIAKRLGISKTTVSLIVNGKY